MRLKGWDYRNPGIYYITICTLYKQPHFGEVKKEIMGLSEIGCIVWKYWYEIPQHYNHIKLDSFIVMPDHIHGLIEIIQVGKEPVEACHGKPPHGKGHKSKFGKPQPKSLSMVINQFKGAVTRWCNKNGHNTFKWQSSFHDKIIFNRKSLNKIRTYIQNNPIHPVR